MRWISDDGLVEIANLNLDFAAGVSDRAKIAHVAIAANPNLRPLGKRAAFQPFEPLIVANRIAPHVGMRGSGLFVFHYFFALDISVRQLEKVASWTRFLSLSPTPLLLSPPPPS